jgi:hypothetical protein
MELVVVAFPLLSAAAGYLLNGVTGAASGLLIPLGPLLEAWLFYPR